MREILIRGYDLTLHATVALKAACNKWYIRALSVEVIEVAGVKLKAGVEILEDEEENASFNSLKIIGCNEPMNNVEKHNNRLDNIVSVLMLKYKETKSLEHISYQIVQKPDTQPSNSMEKSDDDKLIRVHCMTA